MLWHKWIDAAIDDNIQKARKFLLNPHLAQSILQKAKRLS